MTRTVNLPEHVRPHCAVFGSDGVLYVAAESIGNVEPGSVSILALQSPPLAAVVDGGVRTNRISLDARTRRAYTADQDESRLAVVDHEHALHESWSICRISASAQR